LAASAPDRNKAVRRNTEEVARRLIQGGVPFSVAQTAAAARIFGPAPGNFGVGMAGMMEASRDAGNSAAAGQLYLKNMNFAYSQELVGQQVEGNLNAQLANNELVIHSRSTNLYGVLDNDDTYQFAGGLTAATRVASGQAPKLLISNVRRPGQESFEGMEKFLDRELRSRIRNPKWIEGMKASGYAGAREIAKSIEHQYGLRSTAPEAVDPSVWKETLEVYVKDKYRLGLDQYFRAANPHAAQMVAARLLEVDRQGVYRFSPEDKRALLRSYVQSINRAGVSCYVSVYDNQRLRQYVATAARTSQAVSAEALAVMEARMQIASGQVPNPAPGPALRPERRTALPRSLSLLDKVRLVDAASFVRRLRRPESFTDWFLLTLLCTTLGTGTLAGVVRTRFTPPPLTTFGATLEATPESLDRPEAGWPIQSRLPSSGLPD
jgi:cobaltochelatase CobN